MTSGEWKEERLYVLKSLETVQQEQRRMSEQAAITREAVIAKQQKDIGAAHDAIRELRDQRSSLQLKNWIITALLSGIGFGTVELVKWLLQSFHK